MLVICTGKQSGVKISLDHPAPSYNETGKSKGRVKLVHSTLWNFVGLESDWLTDDWNVMAHIFNTTSLYGIQVNDYVSL